MILVGATGVGKSFLACALAHQACRKGYRAGYRRASRLFHELALADAICDRLLHNAHRIVLQGPSRRKEAKLDS